MGSLGEPRTPYDAGQTAQPRESGKVVPLVGSMTGITKDVMLNIRRAALSGRAKDFLTEAAVRSFGNAGYAQRAGEVAPGTCCDFDLAEWTRALGWHKPDVLKIRAQVCDLNIIGFEAGDMPGQGTLRWNLDFATWRALHDDYRRARYTRAGAGRPKDPDKQASVSHLNTSRQAGVSHLNSEKKSNDLRGQFKRLTVGISESATDAARAAPKEIEEVKEERDIQRSPDGDLVRARRSDDTPRRAAGKKSPPAFADDSEALLLAAYLRDAIVRHKSDARVPRSATDLQSWARVTDLMLRVDKRAPDTIRRVIDWATRDTFWRVNILSPGSLRDKFDRLEMQAGQSTERSVRDGASRVGAGEHSAPRQAKRGAPTPPDPYDLGEYAHLVKNQQPVPGGGTDAGT